MLDELGLGDDRLLFSHLKIPSQSLDDSPTSIISDETIANDDMVRVQVGVTRPKNTIQTLPSFEEYTPPVTYLEEVEKTLGTLVEVELLDKPKLEEVGLNCNKKTPLCSREVPSFDKLKPQPQPLPNCPPLDPSDLATIDTLILDEDHALLLITSLPSFLQYFCGDFVITSGYFEARRRDREGSNTDEGWFKFHVGQPQVCSRIKAKLDIAGNMGFNESGEYKKPFIGFGVGTGLMHVLHGFEFKVEPLGDHTFELARDKEQHLAYELFAYKEDNNEAAFAVAAVDKIYTHESLTLNDTVACEVIFKWKAGLKEDMYIRLDVYVLSNGCRKSSDDSHNYLWEYAQEDSLSGDCDVEKNGKGAYRYAVGSQEYQVICTRPNIASAGVDILDGFDRGYGLMIPALKEAIWPRGLLDVLEAKTVKVLKVGTEHNAADVLTKVVPRRKLQHCLELLSVV
nr:zinc finger, CCHC-type [Tanacetum cinerariifolium]